MTKLDILVDTREQKPYGFNRYDVTTHDQKLLTGDYALKGDGEFNSETFEPAFAVERKNPDDFLNSITWERDRFEDELRRADSFDSRMPVIIEAPWEYFMQDRHFRDVHPNSIKGTVQKHPNQYNAEYFFTRDRRKGTQLTYEYLEWRANQLGRI